MALRTIYALVKSVLLYYPQVISTTVTSTKVDMQQFGAVMFEIAVGAFAFSGSNKISWQLQESDDDQSDYTAVADADYLGSLGASPFYLVQSGTINQESIFQMHYRGSKRYVKVVGSVTGSVSVAVSVTAVKAYPELQPPIQTALD